MVPVKHQSGLASKPDWEAFHNVQIRGFGVDCELVCVTGYGDISESQTRKREVQCDQFPLILVLSANPCGSSSPVITYKMPRWNPVRSCIRPFPFFEGWHMFSLVLKGQYSIRRGENPA